MSLAPLVLELSVKEAQSNDAVTYPLGKNPECYSCPSYVNNDRLDHEDYCIRLQERARSYSQYIYSGC